MRRIAEIVYPVVLTFWVGAMWTIGYIVAPMLFSALGDRQLAGVIAGKLFHLLGWIGLGCAACLVLFLILRAGRSAFRTRTVWLVLLMALLSTAGLFGIQPLLEQLKLDAMPQAVMESVFRDRFVAWHGISSVMYLLQSLFGLVLVVDAGRGGAR